MAQQLEDLMSIKIFIIINQEYILLKKSKKAWEDMLLKYQDGEKTAQPIKIIGQHKIHGELHGDRKDILNYNKIYYGNNMDQVEM